MRENNIIICIYFKNIEINLNNVLNWFNNLVFFNPTKYERNIFY